jgi:hypothetical protein
MTAPTFDINAAIQALREGKDLTGKDGILTPLIKKLTKPRLLLSLWGTSPPIVRTAIALTHREPPYKE